MNGAAHYREAELLLDALPELTDAGLDRDAALVLISQAQVHATLAYAAATAMSPAGFAADGKVAEQWRETIR